nr:uncharacterized protein I303_01895 [Kwoniella dejecticola CBS 10117]OBR87687.1 hypothetical protein I303_01895 [Kwoniella dejecticola CBS 10117]
MSPHHPRKARQPTAGPRPADEESNIGLLPHHVLRDKSSSEGRIGEEEDHSRFKIPSIPKEKMIIWRISIILLFIIPACLLYLITCSDPSWRTNWSVVKVHLPSQEWGIISSKGRQLGRSYTANITKRAEENGEEADNAETEDGGWLSVNMWGWCLQGISKTE